MSSLIRSWLVPRERSLSIDDVADIIRRGGYTASSYPQPSLSQPHELIGYGYENYVHAIMQANPIVYSAMTVRAEVFSQARFIFRKIVAGEPGRTFGMRQLGLIEKPEPTMVTSDLLYRTSLDVDLAGNWFGIRRPDRIKRVRPDWCYLVLGSEQYDAIDPRDVDAEVIGLIYQPGGPYSDQPPQTFAVGEFAHFAPYPDPLAHYRGSSWLTPLMRDVEADQAMTLHKLMFMRQGATPSIVVRFPATLTPEEAAEMIELFEQEHVGVLNAYKTAFLGGGSDLSVVGSSLQQTDFKTVQGSGETRIAAVSRVPAVLLGISEGLQGSSLNAGNYDAAKRGFADTTMRHMWQTMASSLESIIPPPSDAELWYNERLIPFLAEAASDTAAVQSQQAGSIRTLVDGGFEPDDVIDAIVSNDLRKLTGGHTGLLPVQLQPPGESTPAPVPEEEDEEEAPPPDADAIAALARDLLALIDPVPTEVRCSCGRLLAEAAAPPYSLRCSKCHTVTSVGREPVGIA